MLRIEARKSDSVRLVGAVGGSFSHSCGCATKELGFRKCCESKLVRATENSPWREPWGDRQVHEAPARGERSRRRRLPPHPGLSARAFFPWLAPWALPCRPVGLEQRPWVLATHRFTRVPSKPQSPHSLVAHLIDAARHFAAFGVNLITDNIQYGHAHEKPRPSRSYRPA